MPLTRIKINDSASASGAYTFPLNPSLIDVQDSNNYTTLETLDGGKIIQNAYFDSRPVTLRWTKIPLSFSGFPAMLATLKSYKGLVKYINYEDVEYRSTATQWDKVRVVDVNVKIESGGSIKYNVDVTLMPEPV